MKLATLSYLLFLSAGCFGASYQVSINASSLPPGTNGFIDFAFNGGFAATATISNFVNTGGTLTPATTTTQGTISGTLPGTVTMGNNNADYDEGIVYGTPINFLLNLSGTPSGNTGDIFTVSLFDTGFDGLLTSNVNDGWILQFQMGTNGTITPIAATSPTGGASLATVTPVLAAVPEPSSILLILGGLTALTAKKRFNREKSVRQ